MTTLEAIATRFALLTTPEKQRELQSMLHTPVTDVGKLDRNARLMTELRERGIWPPEGDPRGV